MRELGQELRRRADQALRVVGMMKIDLELTDLDAVQLLHREQVSTKKR